jgi:hypothetical protein
LQPPIAAAVRGTRRFPLRWPRRRTRGSSDDRRNGTGRAVGRGGDGEAGGIFLLTRCDVLTSDVRSAVGPALRGRARRAALRVRRIRPAEARPPTHGLMRVVLTAQRSSSPPFTWSGLRNASSLMRIISGIRLCASSPCFNSSAALVNGYGTRR